MFIDWASGEVQPGSDNEAPLTTLSTATRLNLALCCLKLDEGADAAAQCNNVLGMKEDLITPQQRAKALARRGAAYATVKRWNDADADFEAAHST
eukprot:GABW01003475.1.p1 GENE.GABW01003475.1~~GABW01003475.1.p1  ORF type:complete len:95 (-),score=42.47 GABW01003475.1:3-287(-)